MTEHAICKAPGLRHRARSAILSFAISLLSCAISAAPVDGAMARRAVGRWLSHRPAAQMNARMNRVIRNVRTVKSDGEDAFHVVELEGGGFVVASADDRIEPVVAFAESGTLVEDPRNPLWVMLNLDLPRRRQAHRNGKVSKRDPATLRGRGGRRRWRPPAEEWGDLSGTTASVPSSLSQPADIRVSAIVQSTWDQSTVGGKNCYNYYTPNNSVCGCVATAAAQVMRCHRHPSGAVTAKTFVCAVDGVEVSKTMMGGVYAWDDMPLNPDSSITATQCQAIGKICYDAGVATRMSWTLRSSGAVDAVMAQSLVNVFGYSSTKCELVPETLTVEQMQNAIYANLDAGCPVLLGIQTTNLTQNAGHEIIADGYGIYNETIYTHLNLGWSGSCNAWYALPTVSVIGYQFSVIGSVIYNIFPNETGELVTGRVLDDEGRPVAGALLSASYRSGYSTKTSTGISDARGIFVLRVPSGASCSVTATASGFKDGSVSVKVGTSKSTNFSASEMTYSPGSGVIGNRWGNDIILKKAYWIEEPVFVIATRTELAAGRRIETQYRGFLTKEGFLYAWGKNGTAETDWAVGDGLPCELAKPAGDDWELMVMGEEK